MDKLNTASKTLTSDANALKSLKVANEKLAIRKFEQHISDQNIKVIVGAANKNSLEGAIAFAMEKELSMKKTVEKTCNYCKKEGHFERDCLRKNKKGNNSNYANSYKRENSNYPNNNYKREISNYPNNNYKRENSNDNTAQKNGNSGKPNQNYRRTNYADPRKNNENENRNVRVCQDNDIVNLSTIFEQEYEPKN